MNIGREGQSQILAVLALCIFLITIGVSSLDSSNLIYRRKVTEKRVKGLTQAIEFAARRVQQVYQTSASCDPALLQRLLNSDRFYVKVGAKTYKRSVWVDDGEIVVNIGRLETYPASTDLKTVTFSRDTGVELWATLGEPIRTRRVQQILLMNTCTPACVSATEQGCPNPMSAAMSAHPYHTITLNSDQRPLLKPASELPTGIDMSDWTGSQVCSTYGAVARRTGDLTVKSGKLDLSDIDIFKHYLRTGEHSATLPNVDPAGASPDLGVTTSCLDLNTDGLINEVDLGILEKVTRGFLYWIPTHF